MDDRRQRIQEWFDCAKPELPILAILVGALAVVVGLLLFSDQTGLSLLILAAGALILLLKLQRYSAARTRFLRRSPLEQMLQWLNDDFESRARASLVKFGLSPNELIRASETLPAPISGKRRPVDDSDSRGPYLYAAWKLMVAHFSKGTLMLYSCDYDWYADARQDEETEAVGYEHIVSVSNQDNSGSGGANQFVLSLSNGRKIKKPKQPFGGSQTRPANEEALRERAESVVRAINVVKLGWADARAHVAVATGSSTGRQPSGAGSAFCTNCGQRYEDGAIFCAGCGSRRGST